MHLRDHQEVEGQLLSIILMIWVLLCSAVFRLAKSGTLLHQNELKHASKSQWTKGREAEVVFHSVEDVSAVESYHFAAFFFSPAVSLPLVLQKNTVSLCFQLPAAANRQDVVRH